MINLNSFRELKYHLRVYNSIRKDILECNELRNKERRKSKRTDVINRCADFLKASNYLEIGVRNPNDNFNHIRVRHKTSVDPGVEFEDNPVTYPVTSDEFFELWKDKGLSPYDLIFIDGLHLANQVARDIESALEMSTDEAIIILHDCNPPNLYFARENYDQIGPAKGTWNGTTYKAAWEYAFSGKFEMRVLDCDMGLGIIHKSKPKSSIRNPNPYFEWNEFEIIRKESGLLIDEKEFETWLNSPKGSEIQSSF